MTVHRSKFFFWFSLSFLLGIFIRSFFDVNISFLWLFVSCGLIPALLNYKNKFILLFSGIFLFLFLGIWRLDISLQYFEKLPEIKKSISVPAKVIKEPTTDKYRQRVVVSVRRKDFLTALNEPQKNIFFKHQSVRLLLMVPLHQNLSLGEKISLKCLPAIPQNISNSENNNFDYKKYLEKENISYLCKKPLFKKIPTTEKTLLKTIFTFRKKLIRNINQSIPFPESVLAEGLLFGGSNNLPTELKDAFSRTGMTHIVAVSGYNVTIIATYLMTIGIFLGLWRKQAFYLSALGIFIFVAMIGFPGSAVRAGIMGVLILWAIKNSRLANADNALLLAGNIMLLSNPLLLRWDIGFQLSFLATLGIIKTSPFWQKYISSGNNLAMFKEIFFMTVSAQLFVLPIIVFNFHTISPISLPANFLILPIIPLTMLFVLLTAFLKIFFAPISLPFAWLAYWLLFYEIKVIEILSKLPSTTVTFSKISKIFPFLWYGILFATIGLMLKYQRKKQ